MCYGAILEFKMGISVILHLHTIFIFQQMLLSLKILHSLHHPITSGSTTDVTTAHVTLIPLFEAFVSTHNSLHSQSCPKLCRYVITYER